MATLFDSRGHVPAGILRLVAIGESNVAIYPAIGGYGVEDIYLGEFSPHPGRASDSQRTRNIPGRAGTVYSYLHLELSSGSSRYQGLVAYILG